MTQIDRNTFKFRNFIAICIAALCILVVAASYSLSKNFPSTTPAPSTSIFESVNDSTTYTSASEQALLGANRYVADLDKTMTDSAAILKRGQLQELGAQSRFFNALADEGQAKFGKSVFEPLGQCYSAGIFARAWWQSQISAASNAGTERIPGSIKDALNSYQAARNQCLKSADPIAVANADAELDAELRKKFGGGKECLKVFTYDATTKETSEKPRPSHCTN